jgi:peptide/nickel transport system permease protein
MHKEDLVTVNFNADKGPSEEANREPLSRRHPLLHKLLRNPSAIIGLILFLGTAMAGLLAPVITAIDPTALELQNKLRPPFWMEGSISGYWLGTDVLGRGVFSNILYGIRLSILVGISATSISVIVGGLLGLLAGYFRGRLDSVIMRIVDIKLALPTVMVALMVMVLLGSGVFKLILVIGLVEWTSYARTLRGTVLGIREQEFVEASRVLGSKNGRIMFRHILPNSLTPIIILIGVSLPRVILLEATLSFLGLGVPVTVPSLGILISRGYKVLLSGHWWVSIFPGIVLISWFCR